ncbi:MAG: STAS domain-containing protein [Actinomycetota bacterium]
MLEKQLDNLRVRRTVVNSVDIVKAYGKCDVFSVQLFKDVMAEVIDEGNTKLIVDVKDLDCIDSSGLVAVLWAKHKIEEIGGKLIVVGLNGSHGYKVGLVDEFCGLFSTASSVGHALKSLSIKTR